MSEDDLVAVIAAGPYADDDAECLVADLLAGLHGWEPSPLRVLCMLVSDDRMWSIVERARAKVTT